MKRSTQNKRMMITKNLGNASARYLPNPGGNHGSLSRRHPRDRDRNPGASGGNFDSDRQISHIAPTAPEISKTTIVSEIKIWIIVRIFAQRASNGASVGPNVELWVKATKR